MADKITNPYLELFESLPIPARLEPENIAAMLAERSCGRTAETSVTLIETKSKGPEVSVTETVPLLPDITVTRRHRVSKVYRSLASVAACAALVLGVLAYMGYGDVSLTSDNQPSGGSYASDYGDVHKTFEKYYVDPEGKKTLDSAISDIEHSYNENDNDSTNSVVPDSGENPEPEDSAVTDPVVPDVSESPVKTDPVEPAPPVQPAEPAPAEPVTPPSESVDDSLPLPEKDAEVDNSDVLFGEGFVLVRDENVLRIFTTSSGNLTYTGNIFPTYDDFAPTKTLAGFYSHGNRVAAVYSVVSSEVPAPVDGLLDGLYGAEPASAKSRSEIEVCIYEIEAGVPTLVSTTVHGGSLIDMTFSGNSLYLATVYSDYRNAPIIGVEDLESYVPSYSVNGQKFYVQAGDIMIPDYISNTDYTVVSGISLTGSVSVKAVLGYEGRVIMQNGAVYLMNYDSAYSTDRTSVKVFALTNGNVVYAGYVDIDGIALGGDGVSVFGNAIAVTAVRKNDDGGYTTTLGLYDVTMNMFAYVDFRGYALTSAKRIGNCLYLSGAKAKYGVSLADPGNPELISAEPKKDAGEGLMPLGDGYVTLTKSADGSLMLSKLVKTATGDLRLDYKTVVSTESGVSSAALENNGLMFVSGDVVGLPYSFFDGYDYCYRYALFRAQTGGFVPMGEIERHETDSVYEYRKALLNGGVLYIFSEGRVSSAVVGESLSALSSADIVPSAYSGH